MEITKENVTPTKAERWLNVNKANRRMREGIAEKYADDMRNGRWTSCPEPISFFDDGDLADGQHRLWAIVESGVSVEFPIARGLTRNDGLNLNTGLGRTLVDNARISGTDTNLSVALVSTARAMAVGGPQSNGASNAAKLALVELYREPCQFACTYVKRVRGLCGATVMAAVARAHTHETDHARLQRFCDVLATGFYTDEGETAAVALRNYLLTKGAIAQSSALWRDTFFKCQNAISYFMRNKRLAVIKVVSDEPYPLKVERLKRSRK